MVLDNRCLTAYETIKSISIHSILVHIVLIAILGMSKLSAVPRSLTSEHKLKRFDISTTLLTYFQDNSKNFHSRLVTKDETWVHHFKPESKIQCKQWKHSSSLPPKKFKQTVSIGKVWWLLFCFLFWRHNLGKGKNYWWIVLYTRIKWRKQSSQNTKESWEQGALAPG